MLNTVRTPPATARPRSHSGTKRSLPLDKADFEEPYKNSLPRIDPPPLGTSSIDSPPPSDSTKAPRSSAIFPSFRSVSACNRCRNRKNRCDQRLPRCHLCEKAGVHCVGFDPITKREVPRSYVFFLESRIIYLERLLNENGIGFAPPAPHEGELRTDMEESYPPTVASNTAEDTLLEKRSGSQSPEAARKHAHINYKNEVCQDQAKKLSSHSQVSGTRTSDRITAHRQTRADFDKGMDNLVSNIVMVPVQGMSDSRYLGSTSGISFARVVFAAVRSSVPSSTSERGTMLPSSRSAMEHTGSSMRDSFFGLQVKPSITPAQFPDSKLARHLVDLYFEYANPQAPILHREEFMDLLQRVYSTEKRSQLPRDLYLLNIVCAIGAGIIFGVKKDAARQQTENNSRDDGSPSEPYTNLPTQSGREYQPEEYHASAIVHLESCLSSSATDGFGGGLEELQAVLLLASFALLRPVAPGLWYIVGVAVRLAVDLGLHHEDGTELDFVDESVTSCHGSRRESLKSSKGQGVEGSIERPTVHARERGRREWVRDLRRRLWWSVYSFDRLVSTCVGRPFGITDQVITTEFPSLLDDKYITKSGFLNPPAGEIASYKHVAHHYLKFRLLQSEIQQVLQYQHAHLARKSSKCHNEAFIPMRLPSPFLQRFDSFRSWRRDVHRRLDDWIRFAPTPGEIGVQFSVEFFELNYWQALMILYRQGLTVPAALAADLTKTEHVMSPSLAGFENSEDEDEIYIKVAEAGQKTLRLYRQLHRVRLVNYTYLATHHLFMAGVSFLYAIWHSPTVRNRLTLDEVDFTVLGAVSVLEDLMEKCPPAEACRDAFERMSKATVQMCLSTTGFGPQSAPLGELSDAGTKEGGLSNIEYQQTPDTSTKSSDPRQTSFDPRANHAYHDVKHELSPVPNHLANACAADYNEHQSLRQHSSQPTHVRHSTTFSNTQPPIFKSPPSNHAHQPQHPYTPLTPQSSQHIYSALPQTTLPHQQSHMYSFPPDLDFLNLPPRLDHTRFYSASGAENCSDPELDSFSMPSPFEQGGIQSDAGVDLGFGMTVGLQNDWSQGSGYDLFGGFFFGNGVGGS
ncbi:hypothetical protein LOZ58_001152 [Ophidiomyces ophidiicola]|nr:hypothetical protein LOZ58_001152 [Ophidiomyces ophidiicola]